MKSCPTRPVPQAKNVITNLIFLYQGDEAYLRGMVEVAGIEPATPNGQ